MKKLPKYIIETLENRTEHEYVLFSKDENFSTGYTIKIKKYKPYQRFDTFKREIERLVNWANKIVPDTAYILYTPPKTHHDVQWAIVTIFDPVMKSIEKYVKY